MSVARDEARHREYEHAQAERHQSRQQAIDRARQDYRADFRARALRTQIDAWCFARDIRAWACAARQQVPAGSAGGEAREWIDWAERHADSIDPTTNPGGTPEVPEPSPDALRPFLRGWSPYGP